MNEPIFINITHQGALTGIELTPQIIAQILGDVPGRVDKLDTCVEKLKRNIDGLVELNVALLGRMKALEHHSHLICTGDQNNEDAWHQTNEPMTTGGGSAAGIDPCPTRPAAQQPAQPVAAHAYTRDSEDTGDCAECGHGMADSVHVDAFPEVTAGMEAIMRGDPEPATDSPAKMRSVASALSYNGAPKEASAKHLLLWGAMRIEALERAQRKATAADGGAGEDEAQEIINRAYFGNPQQGDPARLANIVADLRARLAEAEAGADVQEAEIAEARKELKYAVEPILVEAVQLRSSIHTLRAKHDDLAKRLEAVTRGRDEALSGETKALADLATEREHVSALVATSVEQETCLAAANERAAESDACIGAFQDNVRDAVIDMMVKHGLDGSVDGSGSDGGWDDLTLAEVDIGLNRLGDALTEARAEADAARAELGSISQFQDRLRGIAIEACQKAGLIEDCDGSGCDSGDWQDLTAAEVRIGFNALLDLITDTKAEVAALKGRKVTLPLMFGEPERGDPPDAIACRKMYDDAIDECTKAIRAAGIEVSNGRPQAVGSGLKPFRM